MGDLLSRFMFVLPPTPSRIDFESESRLLLLLELPSLMSIPSLELVFLIFSFYNLLGVWLLLLSLTLFWLVSAPAPP